MCCPIVGSGAGKGMGENTLRLYDDLAWLWPLWRATLRDVGFEVHEEMYVEDEREYVTFACIKLLDRQHRSVRA